MPSSFNIRQIAQVCHEANRALQEVLGQLPSQSWEECDADMQTSVVVGVEKALAGVSAEELHDSWCETKTGQGWVYGVVKDAEAKTHPCLVSYGDLPIEERRKDWLFQAVVTALTVE